MSEHKSGRPYKRSLWLSLLFGLILALAFQTPLWAAPGDNPQEAAGSLSAPSAQAETSASLDQSEGALLAQAEPDKASAGPSRKHKRHKVGGAPTQVRRGAQPSHHKHGKKHLKASHKKSRKDHAGAASSAKEVGSFSETMKVLWQSTGLSAFCTGDGYKNLIMIGVSLVLIYLAIAKGFEPLLLLPIGIGGLLSNIPNAGIAEEGGFLYYIYEFGIDKGIFPLLIFMGVGAMTDFGPLIANPRTALLGGAAQFGIFFSLIGALVLSEYIPGINFNLQDAASIGIIGGADGPTAIFLTSRLSPRLLGSIAVAAYSYMALVPIIQPPIMKALTTEEERNIVMKQLRPVSKTEKIIFPITVILLCALLLPSAAPLIGCLMFGNLARECGAVNRLSDTMQNALCNIVTILLGTTVGSKLAADKFLTPETLGILLLGLVAFCIGTASGVLLAKLMNKMTKDPINPLIGAAGVSAVPMAARVVNGVGLETNPRNFLLMHAMGPNVSGVIGSAVAAGILLAMLGGGF